MLPELMREQYCDILRTATSNEKDIFKAFYSFENHGAYTGQVAKLLGHTGSRPHVIINLTMGRLGKKVYKHYDIHDAIIGDTAYLELFFDCTKDDNKRWYLQLKKNLVLALEEMNIVKSSTKVNIHSIIHKFICFDKYMNKKEKTKSYYGISFSSGFLKNEEQYKERVYDYAHEILLSFNWDNNSPGTGVISKMFLKMIDTTLNPENNLVDWRNLDAARNLINNIDYRFNIEKALFSIYQNNNAAEAFNEAIKTFGSKYDLISFMFFVKDKDKYMPIKPRSFDKSFNELGINHSTSYKCSWENYQSYLDIMYNLREQLVNELGINLSLLDTHTFAWIIQQDRFIEWDEKSFDSLAIPLDNISIKQFDLLLKEPCAIQRGMPISTEQLLHKQTYNNNIGDAGERFIYKYECERMKKNNIQKKPIHASIDIGDGLGYDILSYDETGNEIYIEVKTTEGDACNSIYITRNELEKSKSVGNAYRLYRVYDFNTMEENGKISYRIGSLEDLCKHTQVYRVDFER